MMDYIFKKDLILQAVINGSHSIEELLSEGKGIYIAELYSLLDDLIKDEKLISKDKKYYLQKNLNEDLIEPHPLDYDWRFDAKSIKKIIFSLIESNQKNILLLGSPSIFNELLKYHMSFNKIVLIDWNKEIVDELNLKTNNISMKAYHFDLLKNILTLNKELYNFIGNEYFNSIIIDPPWYVEHYKSFILQSSILSNIGSSLLISLLPLNAKPNAFNERLEIFEMAHKLGFHIEQLNESYISYKTPFFETKSMEEIDVKIQDWRKSDLLILRRIEKNELETKELKKLLMKITCNFDESSIWLDFKINNTKIKLKKVYTDFNIEPKIIKIEEHNILKTVSRRYEKRKYIDIWFHDNRVYGLDGIIYFIYNLHLYVNKELPKEIDVSLLNKLYIDKSKKILEKLLRNEK